MQSKTEKYEAILKLAQQLDSAGKTETFVNLGKWLKKNRFKNNMGVPYSTNPRGIAKVVAAAWDYAKKTYGERKALPIANAFTRNSGEYAWTE